MSFLPERFRPGYAVAPPYEKSVAYFSMEFAIDQALKTYSGGLGFLAGSHLRSAAELGQNLAGIGILWSYGYYDQHWGAEREMEARLVRKQYSFLEDTGLKFPVLVHGHPVLVKALYLPSGVFGSAPVFFLTTDIEENDELSRAITHRLYDPDPLRRIAQYVVLGAGGARLLEELKAEPDVYHLNEAHGLAAGFRLLERFGSVEPVREKLVFTTHTPEPAGNEVTEIDLLHQFSYFGELELDAVREATGIQDGSFNHTVAALRLSRVANAVSSLHGEVARRMWSVFSGVAPITHVTNAQNKPFWADRELEAARAAGDAAALRRRKRVLKEELFRVVADQSGKRFDPDVLTVVWARRFAGYKRADLITHDIERFRRLLRSGSRPVQVIWAGKPFPTDKSAIDLFNHLVRLVEDEPRAAVLTGYELELSRQLKAGADVWLNNPVVTREASGTSGMSAAMNGAVNLSTDDGWVCEFARTGENSFIVPPASGGLSAQARDKADRLGLYELLNEEILPAYYDDPGRWGQIVLHSMDDVAPAFDSGRMAAEYYERVYGE